MANNMKKKISIVLICVFILSACGSSKHANCDAYGDVDNNREVTIS
jgi:protein involved in sex pheromone biosynthesis